jgi:YVTN family beta-propeller protein
MNGIPVGRRGCGLRFAVYAVVLATVASGLVLGKSHPARAWSIIAPVLPRSGSSDGYEISTVPTGVEAQAIAIDPGTHTVFVGSDRLLSVLDERTGHLIGTVSLPGSVVALAVDTTTHRVYALQTFPQPKPVNGQGMTAVPASIAVIDPTGLSIITTYPNLGTGPAFPSTGNTLVDDPVGHRLFNGSVSVTLNGHDVEGATQIDTVTGAVTAVANGYEPNSLGYDPSTQSLYVVDESPGDSVTILSVKGTPRDITSADVGQVPDGIAVDPSMQSVYVANNSGPSVSVIDTRTNKVVKTVTAGAIVSGIGIDTSSHTVFVANGADDNVTVIDGVTNTVAGTIQVGTPQYDVAVDPTTHSVWTTSPMSTSVTALNPIVPRFAGADRFATAVAISANEYPDDLANAVVLARADNFPDALVGAPLAAAKNAPLLFTSGTTLPAVTEAEIRRVLVRGKAVYLLGGPSAIPNQIVAQLTALGYSSIRIAGADRFETAVAVADELGNPTTIFLASGSDFADALTAGPAAAQAQGAILLTSPGGVEISTLNYLGAHSATVYAVGGPAAAADPAATPIFGADRFGTAIAVAQQFFPAATSAGIASGGAFPDALAAGAYMATIGGPLLLTPPTTLSPSVVVYLAAAKATTTSADIFGGTAALSANVQTSAEMALAP